MDSGAADIICRGIKTPKEIREGVFTDGAGVFIDGTGHMSITQPLLKTFL